MAAGDEERGPETTNGMLDELTKRFDLHVNDMTAELQAGRARMGSIENSVAAVGAQVQEAIELNRANSAALAENTEKTQAVADQTQAVADGLAGNTLKTQEAHDASVRVEQRTSDMVELFENGRSFFRVLGAIGDFLLRWAERIAKVARPVAYIAGAITAVAGAYAAYRGFGPPPDIGPKP